MEKYRYSDEELAFIERSPIPFAVYQFINRRVVTVALSRGFYELLNFDNMTKEEVYDLMDSNMYRDTHPDDLSDIGDAAYKFATEGGFYDAVYRSKKGDGYRIIHAYGRHIEKENGVRLAIVWYTDQGPYIDDGKKGRDSLLNVLNNKLIERSYYTKTGHDYLTGLPSMTYFFELAKEGCEEMRKNGLKPAILFMNFQGMKVYNQKYGLEEGDRYLKSFAEKIIELFSHENCSRFSADHFCVFIDKEIAKKQIPKLIEFSNKVEGEKRLPLHIGMYIYDDESISISGACDRAKIACDVGKKDFASKVYLFESSMMTAIEEKQYVVENIDKAINNNWIKAYYQPIIRTANQKVCHEEALSRWEDPEKGFISPATFIPALEETNTIYKLDLYVVECVLKKMKEQSDSGLYVVPISVNLSRSDFYTCDIVEDIRKRVDQSGISRDRLVIEITESAVADDVDYILQEIKRFKDLGFSVWMDDYGSGYSSPILLQKIPFDLIKIDMLFVQQIDTSEKSKIILTELVRMAMSLGMDTVAEGVETKEQADFLKDIGCTMLQGYYFCKPISLTEIIERSKKGIQIGFENPKESDYYAQLGKVNLYNLSLSSTDTKQSTDYFDTWPMVMIECDKSKLSVVKANITFKKYIKDNFPSVVGIKEFNTENIIDRPGSRSLKAVLQCAKDGKRVIVDDRTADGKIIQIIAWRIAVNSVTGVSAIMIAILSSAEARNSFADDRKALKKMSGEYAKLQKENVRLKEEADASRKIAELKKSVSALLTNMPAMTFSKDVITRKYLACNQAFADYAHKETPEDVAGLTDFEIFDEATALHFIEDDKKALSMDKPYIFYEDVPDAKGNKRQFQTTKLKFVDDTGRECLLGLCQDVTDAMSIKREYVEKLAQVQNLAHIDALTGIKNKNAYQEREQLMNRRIIERRQPEFAIVVLDVNDLKKINDTLGHKAGDECICSACKIICSTFKRSPVYRVGGDEFVVISQDEDYSRSDELVELISKHNEDAICNGGIVIACGMAKFSNEENVVSVFTKADQNMYENKKLLKSKKNR